MPDSIPGSNFNSKNECYWCQTKFPNYAPKGVEELEKIILATKLKNYNADCLVGLSGGKDSTYALYRLVTHYGLNAEAFTYVHDGTTEFSLENAKRTCVELGVKHHIVQLPRHAHLKSFQSYFQAWLKHPNSVSAGMTCVACKHLHLLGLDIANKRSIPMIVWSSSPLEYSPFLAIKSVGDKDNQFKREGIFSSSIKLMSEMITSPLFAYGVLQNIKTSVYGCLAVFPTCNYLTQRYPKVKPIMFYDFENWDPNYLRKTIKEKLNWLIPKDVSEDWHSDCTFNVFKEYMFQKMLGVSYTDAHLSNQIRYGYITRDEAKLNLSVSKHQFAKALPDAISLVGKPDWHSKIDAKCFEVDII